MMFPDVKTKTNTKSTNNKQIVVMPYQKRKKKYNVDPVEMRNGIAQKKIVCRPTQQGLAVLLQRPLNKHDIIIL